MTQVAASSGRTLNQFRSMAADKGLTKSGSGASPLHYNSGTKGAVEEKEEVFYTQLDQLFSY